MIDPVVQRAPEPRLLQQRQNEETVPDLTFKAMLSPPDEQRKADDGDVPPAPLAEGDDQHARIFNRDGFFAHARLDPGVPDRPANADDAPHPAERKVPNLADLFGPGAGAADVAGIPSMPPTHIEREGAPLAGQSPIFERPVAFYRVATFDGGDVRITPASTPAAVIPLDGSGGDFVVDPISSADSAEDAAPPPPRDRQGGNGRAALTLSRGDHGLVVSVQAAGLDADEHARLERRIAGEITRHGLLIRHISLTSPPALPARR